MDTSIDVVSLYGGVSLCGDSVAGNAGVLFFLRLSLLIDVTRSSLFGRPNVSLTLFCFKNRN